MISAILYDIPELFYIDRKSCDLRFDGLSLRLDMTFLYSDSEIEQMKKLIYEQIIPFKTRSYKDTYDKALTIHNSLAAHVIYADDTTATHCHNIIGAFFQRETVCEGYAKAYKLICDELEVPCIVALNVKGTHAWNMIKADGNFFHVDATWSVDSYRTKKFPLYFMVSDALLLKTHTIDHSIYPKCTTLSKTEKAMIHVHNLSEFSNAIEKRIKEKQPRMIISFDRKFNSNQEIIHLISRIKEIRNLKNLRTFSVEYHPSRDCVFIVFYYYEST